MGLFSLFGNRDNKGTPDVLSREQSKNLPAAPAQEHASPARTTHTSQQHSVDNSKTAALSDATKRPALPSVIDRDDTTLIIGPSGSLAAPIEATPTIDEAALMYSLGRQSVAEELLQSLIRQNSHSDVTHQAWAMLFDLYEVLNRRDLFDRLSIAYARHFEASPPGWHEMDTKTGTKPGTEPRGQNTETALRFPPQIDANAKRLFDSATAYPAQIVVVRLDFTSVLTIDPAGAGIVLELLRHLQKSSKNILLIAANSLIKVLQTLTLPGRRESGSDPWLLLMEVYRLMDQESAFEECSMDYCVTFEVSPPAFVKPLLRSPALTQKILASQPDAFLLPAVMHELSPAQLQAIHAYAASHDPARFDCSALTRVDFNAAGLLMNPLQELAKRGKVIEFIHLNHLVLALFKIILQPGLIALHVRR